MDTIFKMVVLSWLLSAMPYHANAADMNESATTYTNSAQSSNEDCDLSLQQCVIIHGRSNDCHSDEHQQIKDCASICNQDQNKQKCKRNCSEFTYAGKQCDGSMFTWSTETRALSYYTQPIILKSGEKQKVNKRIDVLACATIAISVLALLISAVVIKMISGRCGNRRDIERRPMKVIECQVLPGETATATGTPHRRPICYDNCSFDKYKKLAKLGSLKMELDGKVFNLQTVVMDGNNCDEFTKLPDELVNLVKEICSDECVSSAILYQSPSDSKELLVVGVGANEKVEAKLQAAVREHFSDFTIYTDAINHYSEHTINYSGYSFTVVKSISVEGPQEFREVQTATCELVLEGESIAANDHSNTKYYAFLPAHFVLEQRDMEMLQAEDVHPSAYKHVQESTAGRSVHSRYELSALNPQKSIFLRSSDAMFAYRQYQQGARKGPEHFSSFYNDSYLLEIEKGYLYQRTDSIISFEELEEAMRTRQDGKVLDEVLPVRHAAQLASMGRRHVRVEVGPSHGYMVCGITPLDDRRLLHHVQFVLEDWPLMEGHSGSIVYVIDADNGHRYRFGMFVGLARRHHRKDQEIYQAIVLMQAIDELEECFSHKVRNLKPLGSSATEEESLYIFPRLVTTEDSQRGIKNSVFIDGNCQDLTSANIGIKAPPDRKYEDDHADQLVKYLDKRGPKEGYHPVPNGIKQFISGVAQEQEVECGAIYQCPLHAKELEIIGMHTSSMSDVIKPSMSEFPGYSFTLHESSDPRHHVEFRRNDIFSVSKGVWQSGRDSETSMPCKVLNRADSSQCGLILTGSAVRRNTLKAYYVVVPAHLVLEKELNESLLEATNTTTMEEMRKEVQSTADKTMYTLHMHNSINTCDIQSMPLFAYRHFITRDSSKQNFCKFTNDLAILKIETDQTRDEEKTGIIPLSKIVSAMKQKFGITSEEQPTVIDDIFPLQYPDTLIEMARVGVRVLIGSEPIKGHLVPCGDPLSSDGRTWSFAIEFITYSSKLNAGDCGLILYVQDTREGKHLYPFGMFIGKSLRKHCCGQTIYRAVVLRQALDEIQSHYDHQVANLRPIGRADNRETDGADWVPHLQIGEEEDLESATCLLATNAPSVTGESAGHSGVSGAISIHQPTD